MSKYVLVTALSSSGELLWAGLKSGRLLLVKDDKVVGEIEECLPKKCLKLFATTDNCCFSGGKDGIIKKWKWDGTSVSHVWTMPEEVEICGIVNGHLWSVCEHLLLFGDGSFKCWVNDDCVKNWSCDYFFPWTKFVSSDFFFFGTLWWNNRVSHFRR